MKTFVVILSIAAAVSADIGIGYHYKHPQTSYETPSFSSTGAGSAFGNLYTTHGSGYKGQSQSSGSNVYQTSNAGLQSGFQNQGLSSGAGYQLGGYPSGNSYQSGSGYQTGSGFEAGRYQPNYQSGSSYQSETRYQTGGNSGAGNQYHSTGSSSSYSGGSGSQSTGPVQSGHQRHNQYQTSSQYQTKDASYQQYYNQVQQQPLQIFKHFYVHAAPEEPEQARPRQPLVLPAPQKHYKIIFIKTPAPVVSSAPIIPVQQQNEEKTIVYVLVKKPEEAQDVVIPKIDQKPPTKPEVYFIKYKGKEDSQSVINNIVNEYNSGKENVNVGNSFHSSGTLEGISDIKYDAQFGSSDLQSVTRAPGNQGSSASFSSQSYEYESSGSPAGHTTSSGGFKSSSVSGSQSFGTSDGSSGYQVSTLAPAHASTASGGYDSGFSSTSSSAFGGAGQGNIVSTSQGIPHENYGPPKFRDN